MTTLAIEINDVGLEAAGEAGPIGAPSPGYVRLDGGVLVAGEAARAAARLAPRFVHHRYWEQMDLESVGRPFPRGLRHADLAHAHLSQYFDRVLTETRLDRGEASVLLAIPAGYRPEQVNLLLGIARAGDIPVTGLVDSAVAAVGDVSEGPVLHLDLQLHKAVWTHIEVEGAYRRSRGVLEVVESAGLVALQRAWVRRIAERFVRETRFDPLHRGDSEQQLFDGLPGWVAEVAEAGHAVASLDANGQPRAVETSAADLIAGSDKQLGAILRPLEDPLVDAFPPLAIAQLRGVFVSDRAARVPGLLERLAERIGIEPTPLPPGAATERGLAHRAWIERPDDRVPEGVGAVPLAEALPVIAHRG